jgi:3-methylfumaryl-CoA hydratase
VTVLPEGWTPRPEERTDTVSATAAAALHGLLDASGPPPGPGDPLPPLWHWLAFLPDAPQAMLGRDGHPRLGGFLPPLTLPRRMWAGGRLTFSPGATVAVALRRTSVVADITAKTGRSGDLVFVEVAHRLEPLGAGAPTITETQDLVYRDAPPVAPPGLPPGTTGPGSSPAKTGPAGQSTAEGAGQSTAEGAGQSTAEGAGPDDPTWVWRIDLATDPTLLFRFSALTYNAHRIHYDRAYATEEEGYPGLVVHGPLQAIGLAELCRRFVPDASLSSYAFRARTPAFDGPPLRLRGRPDGRGGAELVAFDHHGVPTLTAEVTLS